MYLDLDFFSGIFIWTCILFIMVIFLWFTWKTVPSTILGSSSSGWWTQSWPCTLASLPQSSPSPPEQIWRQQLCFDKHTVYCYRILAQICMVFSSFSFTEPRLCLFPPVWVEQGSACQPEGGCQQQCPGWPRIWTGGRTSSPDGSFLSIRSFE